MPATHTLRSMPELGLETRRQASAIATLCAPNRAASVPYSAPAS